MPLRRLPPRRLRRDRLAVAAGRLRPPHEYTRHLQLIGRTPSWRSSATDELLDAFKELTLIELSEFVKAFEETFDVTAAAPVAVAAAAGAGAPPPRPRRSRTSSTSSSRPPARRRSRSSRRCASSPSLGLKEAKDLVDGAPKAVLEKVAKEAAEKARSPRGRRRLRRGRVTLRVFLTLRVRQQGVRRSSRRAITRAGGRASAYYNVPDGKRLALPVGAGIV